MSDAFSAIMMVGELVLPEVIDGMIEASATRKPASATHAQPLIDDGALVAAHFARADRMKDGRADVARRGCQLLVGRQFGAGPEFLRFKAGQCLGGHDAARDTDGIGGDPAVGFRGEIVRLDCRGLARLAAANMHGAAALGPQIGDARRDGGKAVQRLAEFVQRQGLHVILEVRASRRTGRTW